MAKIAVNCMKCGKAIKLGLDDTVAICKHCVRH